MIGCEFCVDLGSQICRNSGLSDDELLALPRYRSSDLFTEREKLALDYTVGVMRTPVEVTDELFARVKEHFSDEQLVELTALLTVVNLDRFNAAFGIGSAGFSEGMVCVPPGPPPGSRPDSRLIAPLEAWRRSRGSAATPLNAKAGRAWLSPAGRGTGSNGSMRRRPGPGRCRERNPRPTYE